MNNSIFRSTKFYIRLAFMQLLIAIPIFIFFQMYISYSDRMFRSRSLVVVALMFIGLFLEMSWYSSIFKTALGFNISRQNFFVSSLINKAIGSVIIAAGVSLIVSFFSNIPLSIARFFFTALIFSFTLQCIGDIYGILFARYGKLGFSIYMLSFFIGMVSSILFLGGNIIASQSLPSMFLMLFVPLSSPFYLCIMGGVSAVLLLANWFIAKSFEVRG